MLHAKLQAEHPEFLIDDSIKWNFTKFLIDREGNVVKRFESVEAPFDMEQDIEPLLENRKSLKKTEAPGLFQAFLSFLR